MPPAPTGKSRSAPVLAGELHIRSLWAAHSRRPPSLKRGGWCYFPCSSQITVLLKHSFAANARGDCAKSAIKYKGDGTAAFKLPVGQHVLKNLDGDAVFLRQDGRIYIGQRCRINVPVGIFTLEKAYKRFRLRIVRRAVQGHAALLGRPDKQLLHLQDAVRYGVFDLCHMCGARFGMDDLPSASRPPCKARGEDEHQHGGSSQAAFVCFWHSYPPFIIRAAAGFT